MTAAGWTIARATPQDSAEGRAALHLELVGPADAGRLTSVMADIDGVRDVHPLLHDELD